ncbi:hypothetical protein FJZ36_15975 [Candidatus Poribacteria bacterium]|nr:hypothetical protein [Candidatus Poribacteria bacterium]
MKALLDTNILIHREASTVVRGDIGVLFRWLDRLGYEKWIHPVSAAEIQRHDDERVRRSFAAKLASYGQLRAAPSLAPEVHALSQELDSTDSDRYDTTILNELYQERVDVLITEDRGIARKAARLGVGDRVFTIDAFPEKAHTENPNLVDYKVLAVRKALFGDVDVSNGFFDSFREDYPGFDQWFSRKSQDEAYVCRQQQEVVAFLYVKAEDRHEPYHDITPAFSPRRRLKIGTLKVELNGLRLGERFLKIVFDNALRQNVDEIYVTIFRRTAGQDRLVRLLEDFGFACHGTKSSTAGEELVYTRSMVPRANKMLPRLSFPFVSGSARHFLVPIYPKYHTDLLPDSILKTESPADFVEHEPHRNAISKVYISRSHFRDLRSGDVVVFYRTSDKPGHAVYRSVVTTLGIVESVRADLANEVEFIRACRQRSVFSDSELAEHWRYSSANRPFVVNFLHAYSFPKRPNMKALIDGGVIADVQSAPRGFERISPEQFKTIIGLSNTDSRLIVD